jgi:hypothetical protein
VVPNVCSTSYCVAWRFYSTLYSTVLHLARTCLFYGILCCPGRVRSTAACSVPGSIRFKEASAALYLSVLQQSLLPLDVYVQQQPVLPLCVLQQPVLTPKMSIRQQPVLSREVPDLKAACAASGVWTYLSTRACAVLNLDVSVYESLCCAAPGRTSRCLSPILFRFFVRTQKCCAV